MKKIFILLNLIIFTLCMHTVNEATAKTVSASTASGKPGEQVPIDISIDNWTGVAGGDITLKYDSAKLSVVSAVKNPAFGLNVIINTATPGKVVVTMAGYPGLPGGSGAIINIIFQIAATAPAGSTPLTFDEAQLYDEDGYNIPTTSSQGKVDIIPTGGGKTVSASTASGYPGEQVPIDISIDDWTGVAGGDITLKYDAMKLNVVSAQKAPAFGLNVIINTATSGKVIVTMAGYPGLPSGSGAIINITFQIAATAPASSTPLTFDEAQLYDEDGNNIPTTSIPGAVNIEGGPGGKIVSASTASGKSGEQVPIDISIDDWTGVAGGDITLKYDATKLSVVSAQKAPAFGLNVIINTATAGKVVVTMAGYPGLPGGSGAIINIIFQIADDAPTGNTPLTFDEAQLYDEDGNNILTTSTPGEIIIGGVPEVEVSLTAPASVSLEEDIIAEVVVTQVNELDTARFKLAFDISVVEFQKVDLTGTLTEGASLVVNDTTPGELIVVINLPGVSGVSGAGAIAKVIFKPIATCTSTTLVLSDVMLGDINAKEIPSEIVAPEATVEITSIPGDADGDGDVDILDITKAERIIVGLDEIPPCGNPDCNEDGKFLPNDITCIEYKAAGLPIPTVALASRGESARLRLLTYMVGKRILKATIYTSNVNNLDIAYFALTFNPEVLQLMDVSSGKLTSGANPTANIDNAAGNIRFVLNLPGVTGMSGSGTLAELTFKILKKPDVSENLILSDVFLGDTSGRQINHIIK